MNTSIGFFDEAARVGSIILQTLGESPSTQSIRKYLERVEDIYKLLSQIHDEIAEVLVQTSFAKTMDEASKCLDGIGYRSLEQTFRANKWCDELQRLGTSLRPLSDDAGLTGTDKMVWDEFCLALELREGEVAELYDKKLFDLRQLPYKVTDIELLKKLVNDTSEMLIIQKAKFDLLAKQAKAMRDRIE